MSDATIAGPSGLAAFPTAGPEPDEAPRRDPETEAVEIVREKVPLPAEAGTVVDIEA